MLGVTPSLRRGGVESDAGEDAGGLSVPDAATAWDVDVETEFKLAVTLVATSVKGTTAAEGSLNTTDEAEGRASLGSCVAEGRVLLDSCVAEGRVPLDSCVAEGRGEELTATNVEDALTTDDANEVIFAAAAKPGEGLEGLSGCQITSQEAVLVGAGRV